jgi:hypothetical protein
MQIRWMSQNVWRRKKYIMFHKNWKFWTNSWKLMMRSQSGAGDHSTTCWNDILWTLVFNAHGSTQKQNYRTSSLKWKGITAVNIGYIMPAHSPNVQIVMHIYIWETTFICSCKQGINSLQHPTLLSWTRTFC